MGAPIGNQYAKGNRGGRPSKYNDAVLETTWDYINGGFEQFGVCPTIERLALILGVGKRILYEWEKQEDKEEFLHAIDTLRCLQADLTINKSLTGEWRNNLTIGRLLTTHGYKEKIETDNKNEHKVDAKIAGASPELLDRVKQIQERIMNANKKGAE